jgi:hypothetical protein
MGHDHHFLQRLDRASRAEAEFALALYRDHEALKFILDSARVPPEAERIALEITPGGPHVIVQRDGHFVTCLGSGMSVGPHPVVPRARIDGWLAAVADLRARSKMAALVKRPGEGIGGLFGRVVERADNLSREEFIGISAWQSLLAPEWYDEARQDLVRALQWTHEPLPRCGRRGLPADSAYARWKLFWAIGHQWLLATMGSRDYMAAHLADLERIQVTFSAGVAMLGSTRLSMRAWWGAARIGKPLVAVAKQRLAAPTDVRDLVDAAMTLAVIGLRHAGLRAETRKALAAPRQYGSEELAQGAAVIAEEIARAFDDPEAYDRSFVDMGRELYVERSAHLPAGSPWRFACAADVPDDLARTVALGCDKDSFSDDHAAGYALWSVATIAKAKAEDFYLPREVERALRTPWTPERTEELLGRRARRCLRPEPKRAATTVGRNDPCACGSGRKHKKCCGGWAGHSAMAAGA